ncbi:exopolysaccharide Pel transporter PelG [Celerinatantimonas sp. MCCC 1A17872]|uniref:exopolysaccharide Pel transporter PelG n=1 Tax=Celerinatantimonas sp. MCCC 1A17872 TaxID=3177514 RepID=UPI0038C7FB46
MAGIGFEIRKILKQNTLLSVIQAYGYAGVIGSGPWLLSIVALLVIGLLSLGRIAPQSLIVQFLITVTYMMCASLVVTGGLQLMLTRYISDLIYKKAYDRIVSNLLGAIFFVTLVSLGLCLIVWPFIPLDNITKFLIMGGFVCLCNQWLTTIFLSGMKEYNQIILTMLIGYSCMVLAAIALNSYSLNGLFLAFLIGEAVLLFTFLWLIVRRYPSAQLVCFDFLKRRNVHLSLLLCGLFYNLSAWIDKIIFWYDPVTSVSVLGPLRANPIYDLPIFLAYLSVIPGMAVFLVRIETDFVEQHRNFYSAVIQGASLEQIQTVKQAMVSSVKAGIYDIAKVQGITVALIWVSGSALLKFFHIDSSYSELLNIDVLGVGLQVVLLGIINVMYYLDKRFSVLAISAIFMVTNGLLTYLSLWLGPYYYGYGFSIAVLLTTAIALILLSRQFDKLEYRTFMFQK